MQIQPAAANPRRQTFERRYSVKEAMQILEVTRATLYRMRKRGDIGAYERGGKVEFGESHIQAYLARANTDAKK